ncbi:MULTISPECIES: TlpA family protein disulfide reductase [unclassified Paenibacillus]|uniref:TlpA family protein disulfide reductase n=1 Tax=unclassified Paenibacillus TaxID=185978 RepID=UPI00083807C8|nr:MULTISPECIES: TlpA disulfide reductase family protein [unclassified Paenibacillus]NWL89424.1 TlpA family protein disulfide reductase [Paenibacillus sp. 79R4]
MRRHKWILAGLIILLAAVLYVNLGQGSFGLWGKGEKEAAASSQSLTELIAAGAPKPGTPAPSFTLEGLNGQTYTVGGERDKALLLNFWASWCDPCKEEAPDLVALAKKYGDSLDVYAVNVTLYDQLDKVKKFVEDYDYTFPVLLDKKEEVYRKFNGMAFPTNVLIGKDGVIQEVIIGSLSAKDLEAKLKKLTNS